MSAGDLFTLTGLLHQLKHCQNFIFTHQLEVLLVKLQAQEEAQVQQVLLVSLNLKQAWNRIYLQVNLKLDYVMAQVKDEEKVVAMNHYRGKEKQVWLIVFVLEQQQMIHPWKMNLSLEVAFGVRKVYLLQLLQFVLQMLNLLAVTEEVSSEVTVLICYQQYLDKEFLEMCQGSDL